jgi:hypothetical protein
MTVPMQNSPADILRHAIVQLSLGSDPGDGTTPVSSWPVYAAATPNVPDNVITVLDTDPQLDGRDMPTGAQHYHYGFSIKVRGDSHNTSFRKADAIKVALNESIYDLIVTIPTGIGTSANVYRLHCVNRTSMNSQGHDTGTSKRTVFTITGKCNIIAC